MASTVSPRRFKVEAVETSVKSSKDRLQDEHLERPKLVRRFAPEPIENTAKTNRKFTPEPIESTKKMNRRFAPEPIETSSRSSRKKFAEEWEEQTSPSPRKFKPELVQNKFSSNRKPKSALRKTPQKFAPQLIETAQRSRKAGHPGPTLLPSDKTEATPDDTISPRKARILGISIPPTPPTNTPTMDLMQNPLFLEIQRNASPLSRRRSYFSSSQHSFRVPDLDPIESSESEASSPPSPTTSPSITSDHSFMYKEATRRRESVDDRSSGYLLELAAKAAEKQLREQAMAAYPNDEVHEPVDHFVDRDSDESEPSLYEPDCRRESSFTEVNWELEAMRKYQEEEKGNKGKERQENLCSKRTEHIKPDLESVRDPADYLDTATVKKFAAEKKDPELERMRKGARPPMLGKDIKFPRCASPEPSRFDPTQGCDAVKTAMCYLSEQTKAASEKGESLWCGQGNGRQTSTTPSLWSNANSRASSTHGLWGGFCVNGGEKSPRGPTGILTPNHERANPLSPCPTPAMSLLPPTPPASTYGFSGAADFSGIDEKLVIEQSITEDFGDDFVTQVYNYLSLGYPSMARPFDDELSKISKISVFELRQDDHLAHSRGYIRLGRDGNLTDNELTEETCMRWRALRVYIQEWARQHPNMSEEDFPIGGRGAAIRKGSWAV